MRRIALTVLAALAAGACASSGAIPQPFPAPGGPPQPRQPPVPVTTSAQDGYAVSGTALSFRGVPYRNGGSDPSGFDCSGFVWYVFGQHGYHLPRTVAEQYRAGSAVEDEVRAGDLVFFDTKGAGASHVGISIGGDEFVHAPTASGEVRIERLGSNYWAGRYVGARRIR
jgi:cell wall-associated NlpC family hydrolase